MIIAAMVIWMYILDLIQGENIDYYTVFAQKIDKNNKNHFQPFRNFRSKSKKNNHLIKITFIDTW